MTADKFFKFYKKYGLFVVFVILFVMFAFIADGFLNTRNLINILKQASVYGIMCVGVTIVMVSGGMDMSVGGQIACSGLAMAALMKLGVHPVAAVLAGILVCAAIGGINGLFIATFNCAPMVITLCLMLILNGTAVVTTSGIPIYDFPKGFYYVGQGFIGGIFPFSIIIWVLAIAVGYFLLNKSYFGRELYAIGGNREAARLAGVNVVRTRILSYVINSAFIGIGSWVLLSKTGSASPTAGANYQFDCLTACMLGGVTFGGGSGNVLTTALGVLIISMIGNGLLLLGLDGNFQQIIKGAILLLTLTMDAYQKIRKSKTV